MPEHFDVIVLGIGGMGSAALYHLARRGLSPLGIERFSIPHDRGSSHGHTRIIRLAYYEDPSYVPLLRRAYTLWTELEAAYGQQLLYKTGSIDFGPPDSDVFRGSLHSCIENDLPHEVLNSAELLARFPGYRLPAATMALYQPDGGFLLPEQCIKAHAQLALGYGATVHSGETVQGWDILPDQRLLVRSNAGSYTCEKLVICGGAWAAKLVAQLATVIQAERQVLLWLATKQPQLFRLSRFPVWNGQVEEGRFYGFPEFNPSGNMPGMKFGRYHHRSEACDPDTLNRQPQPEDEALLRAFAARYFPDGAGDTLRMAVCMFTNTPDEHFIIDTLPAAPQVVLAAGFSGHGFKMASVIGELLADLAQKGDTRHNIALHRLARFANAG